MAASDVDFNDGPDPSALGLTVLGADPAKHTPPSPGPSPGWTRESLVRNREKVVCPLTVATVTLSSPVFTPSPPGSSLGWSRESWVRIAQPPLPAPFQVWAGSARAARRLAGYRRLPVYRVPCVRYCVYYYYIASISWE